MTTPKKLIGAAAFSVALAAGGAAGALLGTPLTSGAQESTTSTTAPAAPDGHQRGGANGPKLTVVADALGISEADLRSALESGKSIAEVAEEQGVDVATVIDALVADAQTGLRERITAMVNGEMPAGGGHEGRGGRGGGGGRGGRAFAPDPQAVADALGMTNDDVSAALESGQTLAQIAAAQNVDVQDVIDAMVASATAKIDEKVAAGELDADRAAEMTANLEERITAIVNGERPAHHRGPGHDDGETP